LYYPMLVINAIHVLVLINVTVVVDILPILATVRITKNLEFLTYDALHCTDSDDKRQNEKELEAVAKYHVAIKR
jgi:hypothetical protein